jgi:hypothetical protein
VRRVARHVAIRLDQRAFHGHRHLPLTRVRRTIVGRFGAVTQTNPGRVAQTRRCNTSRAGQAVRCNRDIPGCMCGGLRGVADEFCSPGPDDEQRARFHRRPPAGCWSAPVVGHRRRVRDFIDGRTAPGRSTYVVVVRPRRPGLDCRVRSSRGSRGTPRPAADRRQTAAPLSAG